MRSPLGRYREATRSWTVATLFYQIVYWVPRAHPVYREGHAWIAKSAKDWCNETGLTPDQYERAIHKLRKLGFVITEQHLFKNTGKAITHLRLTDFGKILAGH